MNKKGFNPRINKSNVYKMTTEELDIFNKHLEKELKSKKNLNALSPKHNHSQQISTDKAVKESKFKKSNLYINTVQVTTNQGANKSVSPGPRITKIFTNSNSNSIIIDNNADTELNLSTNTKRTTSAGKKPYSFKNKLKDIEFVATKTTKNLIPMSRHSHLTEDDDNKMQLNRLKLCQRHHLPKEKNYFISAANLKLIEGAISEKDSDIQSLKDLLKLAKEDINSYESKYEELYLTIEELHNEKNQLIGTYEGLHKEYMQFKENYDDISFQYNKILILFKKVEKLMELLSKDEDVESNMKTIIELIKSKELKNFGFLYKEMNGDVLNASVDSHYKQLENQNKQLKKKIYDYETHIAKLNLLMEHENLELPDVVKDMISMKERIADLNGLNENLERENEYLRISYHNLSVRLYIYPE
jgi:chromosome segregation ATPase